MKDSYEQLFSLGYITKEQFFNFGLKETIYVSLPTAREEWKNLKARINNNQEAYIRGFGRKSGSTHLFQDFYRKVLNNHKIIEDPTNNHYPTQTIKSLTGYSKTPSAKHEPIRNYQISHIFGRTKNAFAFTAPWNIAYIPKVIDPFTGHEAKGTMIDEYQALFQQESYNRFKELIEDFNETMSNPSLLTRINEYLCALEDNKKIKKAIAVEFSPIILKKRA